MKVSINFGGIPVELSIDDNDIARVLGTTIKIDRDILKDKIKGISVGELSVLLPSVQIGEVIYLKEGESKAEAQKIIKSWVRAVNSGAKFSFKVYRGFAAFIRVS